MPSVGEVDLLARQESDPHVRNALTDPTHLAVVHREEAGSDVGGVAGARAETPRAAQLVATVDCCSLAVGKVLTADGDAAVVPGEYLVEALVGKVRGGRKRRRQVGNSDPTERTVLPSHFDPSVDHLPKRRLDTVGGFRIERGHQATGPHLVDNLRRKAAQALRFGSL